MVRSRLFVVLAVLIIAGSVAQAKVENNPNVGQVDRPTESNGTWGNFSMTGGQSGPLQVTVNVSATTAGNGNNTVLNMIFLQGQVYNGLWTTQTWTSIDHDTFPNSSPNLSFNSSFTFTVPAVGNYAIWSSGFAGIYYGTTTGGVYGCSHPYCYTQTYSTCCYPVTAGGLFYVDDIVQPTPTPPPPSSAEPVPSLNKYGIAAMILILVGVGILVMWRRN